jgi:hypothetical protein
VLPRRLLLPPFPAQAGGVQPPASYEDRRESLQYVRPVMKMSLGSRENSFEGGRISGTDTASLASAAERDSSDETQSPNLSLLGCEMMTSHNHPRIQPMYMSTGSEHLPPLCHQAPGIQVSLDVGFPLNSKSELLSILHGHAEEIYNELDKVGQSEFAIGLDHLSPGFLLANAKDKFRFTGMLTLR